MTKWLYLNFVQVWYASAFKWYREQKNSSARVGCFLVRSRASAEWHHLFWRRLIALLSNSIHKSYSSLFFIVDSSIQPWSYDVLTVILTVELLKPAAMLALWLETAAGLFAMLISRHPWLGAPLDPLLCGHWIVGNAQRAAATCRCGMGPSVLFVMSASLSTHGAGWGWNALDRETVLIRQTNIL